MNVALRGIPLLATTVYSLGIAAPQLLGIVLLEPAEYGAYSAVYLVYALCVSVLLSVISESWARNGADKRGYKKSMYFSSCAWIALAFGFAAGFLGLAVTSDPFASVIAGGACASAGMWGCVRYYWVASSNWRRVLLAECAGLFLSLAAFVSVAGLTGEYLVAVFVQWGAFALSAVLVAGSFKLPSFSALRNWIRLHKSEIRALLPESLLMDAGSVGGPFLLLPLLGPAGFARYRAVSSVAFPVRLLISALRPSLARALPSKVRGLRIQASLLVVSIGSGVAASILIFLIADALPRGSVLSELGQYALAIGVFVATSAQHTVNYIVCRIHLDQRTLLVARLTQTIVMLVSPLVGFAISGEGGAVTGFVGASVAVCFIWQVALYRLRVGHKSEAVLSAPDRPPKKRPIRPDA